MSFMVARKPNNTVINQVLEPYSTQRIESRKFNGEVLNDPALLVGMCPQAPWQFDVTLPRTRWAEFTFRSRKVTWASELDEGGG